MTIPTRRLSLASLPAVLGDNVALFTNTQDMINLRRSSSGTKNVLKVRCGSDGKKLSFSSPGMTVEGRKLVCMDMLVLAEKVDAKIRVLDRKYYNRTCPALYVGGWSLFWGGFGTFALTHDAAWRGDIQKDPFKEKVAGVAALTGFTIANILPWFMKPNTADLVALRKEYSDSIQRFLREEMTDINPAERRHIEERLYRLRWVD